jgi:hypothetical protein
MSGPSEQSFELYKSNSRTLSIKLVKSDGTPLDVAASILRYWVGRNNRAKGSDIYIQKFTGDGSITLAKGVDGFWYASIPLLPDDTENLDGGSFYHELECVDAADHVSTLMTGKFKIVPTIIDSDLDVA